MPTNNYALSISLKDKDFGTGDYFNNTTVELWKQEKGYSELIASTETTTGGVASVSFSLTSDDPISDPTVFFKVFVGESSKTYYFEHNQLTTTTVTTGSNSLVLVVELEVNDLGDNQAIDCVAQLSNAEGKPHTGVKVNTDLLYNGKAVQTLTSSVSNNLGFITFRINKDKETAKLLAQNYDELSFDFTFLKENDEEIASQTVSFTTIPDLNEVIFVTVELDYTDEAPSETITNVTTQLGITVTPVLAAYLDSAGISTLRDIRKKGALHNQAELSDSQYDSDADTIAALDAHAQLETLSSDYEANNHVIQQGYTSIFMIANENRATFASKTTAAGTLSNVQAVNMHRISMAQQKLYQSVFAEYKVKDKYANYEGNQSIDDILAIIEDKCNCTDCEAAVSPFAYLADLLWYTKSHLEKVYYPAPPAGEEDGLVTIPELESLFCIDFSGLLQDCDELHKKICQYRIAIEVLNCYKAGLTPDACQYNAFAHAEQEYLETAYYSLLQENGTNFSEVREAANSSDESVKQKLADKLGIILTFDDPDDGSPNEVYTTDKLYLTWNSTDPLHEISHENLETIFGLRDYTRGANDDTQPEPYIIIWRREYQRLQWLTLDGNNDVYSLASTQDPNYIIDPDLLSIDDFRPTDDGNPGVFDLDNNPALNIWKVRRQFVDKMWADVFYNASNWSEEGVEAAFSTLPVLGIDLTGDIFEGSKIRIINSPGSNGVYTVKAITYNTDTSIDVFGKIATLDPAAEVAYSKVETISGFTTTDIQFTTIPTELAVNDFVEVRGSMSDAGTNDGIYKITGITGNNAQVDRTLLDSTNNDFASTGYSLGETVYQTTSAIDYSNASITNNVVRFEFNSDFAPTAADKITISDATLNDGNYTVAISPATGNTVTTLSLDEVLPDTSEEGNVTFYSRSLSVGTSNEITEIVPLLGQRSFTFEQSNLDGLFTASDAVKVLPTGGNTSALDLNIATVNQSGAYTIITVDEPFDESLLGGRFYKEYTSVSITNGNEFDIADSELTGIAFTDLYDVSDPERNKVLIDGEEYTITALQDDLTNTTFTIDGTLVNSTADIGLFFTIFDVDTSGKGFELVDGTVSIPDGVFAKGDLFYTNDGAGTIDEYTVVSAVYDSVNLKMVLEVEETVYPTPGGTPIDSGTTYFKKTLPILKKYPYVDSILSAMETAVDCAQGNSTNLFTETVWNLQGNLNLNNLVNKKNALLAGDDSIVADVESDLQLDRDAFVKLAGIYEQYKKERAQLSDPVLSGTDYDELFNILTLATKNKFKLDWYNEEVSDSIRLDYQYFWVPIVEPREGNITIFNTDTTAYLDPEVIGYGKMPDNTAGAATIALFNERKDQLKTIQTVLADTYANFGFDQVLKVGLGGVNATDSLAGDLDQLLTNINKISQTEVLLAEKAVTNNLLLSVDDFRFVMQLKSQVSAGNIPSSQEFTKLYSILGTAYKKRNLLSSWAKEELTTYVVYDTTYSHDFYEHWQLAKASLPRWRSSISDRKQWQVSLQNRNDRPIVDPDLVFAEDFKAFSGNAARTLWNSRKNTLGSLHASFDADLVNTAIVKSMGVTSANEVLSDLPLMEDAGVDIDKRLKQLHLTYPAYKRLKTLVEIYNNASIRPDEQKELVDILVQCYKFRMLYGTWNDEESGFPSSSTQVSLSPYFFKVNEPEYPGNDLDLYSKLKDWRATWKERTSWERKLKSRVAQLENLDTALENAIKEVEENTLPIMRDALVQLCGDEEKDLNANAEALSTRLMIDLKINCCQYITRLTHAIEVLQQLLWTESIGIDKDITLTDGTKLEFELNADHFEEEWKWMGSYSTWRAAMFVFMYPENLLLPSLRYEQTPGFYHLVSEVRGNNRLTPLAACQAAQRYSEYFDDITNLDVQATVNTIVRNNADKCLNSGAFDTETVLFAFASSKKTPKAYWLEGRGIDLNPKNGEYSYWNQIEGLGENVTRLLGASVYEQDSTIRHIYLFAHVYEDLKDKIVFIKYDLENRYWDTEYTELTMPDDVDFTSIRVLQSQAEKVRPELIYKGLNYQALFVNYLNRKGKDWENDDWQIASPAGTTKRNCATLKDYVLLGAHSVNFDQDGKDPFDRLIIGDNPWSYSCYKLHGPNDDLLWRGFSLGGVRRNYKGGFLNVFDGTNREFLAFFNDNGTFRWSVISPGYLSNNTLDSGVKTFSDLDGWIREATRTSMNDFQLNDKHAVLITKMQEHIQRRINHGYYKSYHKLVRSFLGITNHHNTSTIESIFQTFQYVYDDHFTVPGSFQSSDIDYRDTRKEMNAINDWLINEFAEKDESERARDLKWFSSMLLSSNHSFWKDYRPDNTSASHNNTTLSLYDLINSFLNFTIWGQYGGEAHNTFDGKHRLDWDAVIKRIWRIDSNNPISNPVNGSFQSIIPNSGKEVLLFQGYKEPNALQGDFFAGFDFFVSGNVNPIIRITPLAPAYVAITEEATTQQLTLKKVNITANYAFNTNNYDLYQNRDYFREAYYFVPMYLGIQLSQRGHFEDALKWFRTVYNFADDDPSNRIIYGGLELDSGSSNPSYNRNMADWLLDPLNPHKIAMGREYSYLKYTLYTIAQSFISYGNELFSRDTIETVAQARELYEFAIELLGHWVLKQKPDACDIELKSVVSQWKCLMMEYSDDNNDIFSDYSHATDAIFDGILDAAGSSTNVLTYATDIKDILSTNIGTVDFDMETNIANAHDYVDNIVPFTPKTMAERLDERAEMMNKVNEAVMTMDTTESAAFSIKEKQEEEYASAMYQVSFKTSEEQQDKNLSVMWLEDKKQTYSLQLNSEDSQALYKETKLSLIRPDRYGVQYFTYQYSPQDALNEINSYPFPYVPIMGVDYCVPENPVFKTLSLSAELNLFKIRNCMNIAGMKRELDAFAAPTDTTTGLPQIGANGQIVLPGLANIKPTIYRYEYLLERAKLLVSTAQQVESAFLSALEKRDAEYYNVLKAKQDLGISKATVKLKDLQVKVAEGEVDLAMLQRERSQIQVQELDNMINAGLNEYEQRMINMYYSIAALETTLVALSLGEEIAKAGGDIIVGLATNAPAKIAEITALATLGAIKIGVQISKSFLQAGISVAGIRASQARREQDWNFQKTLATQDIKIGDQQVKNAQDRVRVADQDRNISELQVQFAEDTIDFLNNKFTNADLYDWMSGVLENIYSYFLQEATNVAKIAQNQLAFERQELPAGIIQDNYWETPTDNYAIQTPGANAPDRRGLTGSARLLQDITRLDQYAFENEKRKLQISRTFSLASLSPMEFQQFKETGVITFDTLMEYFDRDFPGHYLRLIKKVKTNVIALIPPSAGIKATLTSSGISHTVIGGSVFQDVIIRRTPEMVALSAASDATGVFELQAQDQKLLNPFEGSGVHTRWEFKMPKDSNMFDYNSIADVLITIEYTAIHSYDYEQQVLRRLGRDFTADRAFSFRTEFADAFYALNHPDEFDEDNRMKVDLDIRDFDFPANITDVVSDQLKFYFVVENSDPTEDLFVDDPFDVTVTTLPDDDPTPITGTGSTNSRGIISTLIGGTTLNSLLGRSPVGKWTLDFSTAEDQFVSGKIVDVIFVITYSGTLPERN